jgi:hypothetical protein
MSENKNQNVKNAMCYIPFVAFILFFVEKNVSKEYNTHMKY